MTDGGTGEPQPKTDEKTLEKLAAIHPIPALVMEHRKLETFKGRYVTALVNLSNHYEDHRIHPGFKQFGTVTGRFSTTVPNSQNFPRPDTDEFGIRSCFTASRGNKLIVVDYGQLEMRIMAHFSDDEGMIGAIRAGKDLHCFAVEKMYGIPYDKVMAAKKRTEEVKWDDLTDFEKDCLLRRQRCKNVGFAIFYGAGAPRVSNMLKISKEEAQDIIDLYFDAFPGVLTFMKSTVKACKDFHFVVTFLGRRRNLAEITSKDFGVRAAAERESVNSIIQGTAADLAKAAMILCEFDEELTAMGVELVNQIHDELVFECPEEFAEIALPRICKLMVRPLGDDEDPLDVPTPVDGKIVDNWAEAK